MTLTQISPPTRLGPLPISPSSAEIPFDSSHRSSDYQRRCAAVDSLDTDQRSCVIQEEVVGVTLLPSAMILATPTMAPLAGSTSESQEDFIPHMNGALGTPVPAAMHQAEPVPDSRRGPILFNGYLCLLSDSLDGIEDLRIATENRVRSLTRTETDVDGELRGLGLDARSPEVARAIGMAESIAELEHQAVLELQREVRKSPLYGWVKRNKGVGEKQAARLLAVLGDPYWNDLHDRPRTVSELWAYAGYSVQVGRAQRRTKGQKSNWNDKAKSRAFLMATSCIKALGGHYRTVYEAAREQYTDALHPHDCVRCGPAGKPALAGTPLSAGHQHARALRRVSKEILKDLWLEARAIHEGELA